MTTPDFDTSWELRRTRRLRSARRRASAILVGAVAVLVATVVFTDDSGVWGFVRAAAEASVVGGVADWFAVTALFRHPLGVPIPHTAIIPKGKDVFGRSLGEFIANNFLDPEHLEARLREIDPAARLGSWLADPDHAAVVARQAANLAVGVADAMSPEEVQGSLRSVVEERLRTVDIARILGSGIDMVMEGDHHHSLIDAGLKGLGRSIQDNQQLLRDLIRRESPWWVPEPIDDRVFQRVYDGLQNFVRDVGSDPHHEIRKHIDERAAELATRLRTSPQLKARAEELKRELLDHPEFEAWVDGLWVGIKERLTAAADHPESELRLRLQESARQIGQRLADDPELRQRVNDWLISVSRRLVEQSGDEVTEMIASTVERWDAGETSRRLELLLGRDLQFIRINGTLVGGLIGLIIHTFIVLVG